jgi:hypothetical protein
MKRFRKEMNRLSWGGSDEDCRVQFKRISWDPKVPKRLILNVEKCAGTSMVTNSKELAFDWNHRAKKFSSTIPWEVSR